MKRNCLRKIKKHKKSCIFKIYSGIRETIGKKLIEKQQRKRGLNEKKKLPSFFIIEIKQNQKKNVNSKKRLKLYFFLKRARAI
jgi:hypothetical protein